MNKTININIGGSFFHIDENAYTKLRHYLDAISASLSDDPEGKEEILKDIEQRISELLSKKITNKAQVVSENDIDEIIVIMGQPEDYSYDDELFTETTTRKSRHKVLYRDGKNKTLGGVSAGLAHYIGMDVTLMRILWVIFALVTSGAGILVYIIFWIVIPEATTTAEQLEMKGKPVNIDNIEQKIREEYHAIKGKVKNADYSKMKSGFQDFLNTLGSILLVILKVIGKIVGALLLLIATMTLIGLIFGFGFWESVEIMGLSSEHVHVPSFFQHSFFPRWLLILFAFLAIGIPFLFLFILGLNILSKRKRSFGKTLNLSLLGIWIISLFGLIYSGIEHNMQYATYASINEHYDFNIPSNDTLFITMRADDKIANRKSIYRSKKLELVTDSLNEEKLYSSNIRLDIRKSNIIDGAMIKIIKSTWAFNRQKAKENAETFTYHYSQEENQMNLNAYFLVDKDLKNNRPRVEAILYIPQGRYIYLGNNTRSFLYDVKNKQNIYDGDMPNHYYLMTDEGLECTDCPEEKDKDLDLEINKKGVKLYISDGDKSSEVKIDEEGIEIK